jgi:hypothetical protein
MKAVGYEQRVGLHTHRYIHSTYMHTYCPGYIHAFNNTVACGAVPRQRLRKHVSAATNTHATIEVLLETVVSTRPGQRGYKEDN